jgi:predicted dehydrogenase
MNSARAPVKLAVVGAGSRGAIYAQYALDHPDQLEIVAIGAPGSRNPNLPMA